MMWADFVTMGSFMPDLSSILDMLVQDSHSNIVEAVEGMDSRGREVCRAEDRLIGGRQMDRTSQLFGSFSSG